MVNAKKVIYLYPEQDKTVVKPFHFDLQPRQRKVLRYCLVGGAVVGGTGLAVLIGLPFFLNSPVKNCGRNLESKIMVGSMNRAQQVYYLEQNKFATTFTQLGLKNVEPQTEEYVHLTVSFREVAFNYALSKVKHRKSRVSGVFPEKISSANELATVVITCEATTVGTQAISPPVNAQTCSPGTIRIDN